MMFFLILLTPIVHAASSTPSYCPDLTGDYTCPAYGDTQPESRMNVDLQSWNGVTTYIYTFEDIHPPGKPNEPTVLEAHYSIDGEIHDDQVFRCENDRLAIFDRYEPNRVQFHTREKGTGDYIVTFANRDGSDAPKIVQRCVETL